MLPVSTQRRRNVAYGGARRSLARLIASSTRSRKATPAALVRPLHLCGAPSRTAAIRHKKLPWRSHAPFPVCQRSAPGTSPFEVSRRGCRRLAALAGPVSSARHHCPFNELGAAAANKSTVVRSPIGSSLVDARRDSRFVFRYECVRGDPHKTCAGEHVDSCQGRNSTSRHTNVTRSTCSWPPLYYTGLPVQSQPATEYKQPRALQSQSAYTSPARLRNLNDVLHC